ncbi:MAG: M56 family metallopeptidase [Oscillospiraceae bacterium]|nr:M56 family metallopeptidase [Oscillospiraceae bacterium]
MIDGLLRTALTGSAVTLAWTAANALHGKHLPALWHYRVLKLALLLFLVPVWPLAALAAEALTALSPGLPVTTTGIAPAPQIPVTALPPAAVSPAAPMAQAAPAALSVDLIQILTAVWAVGAAAVLAYKLWVYLRFRRSFLGQNRPVSDPAAQAVFTDCKARLGIRRTVALQENPLVPTPLSTGLLRPVVVLPALPLSPEELRYLFLHELTHIKRHDLWMRFFSMLAAALHWYDPLVYLLNRQIRDFSEQSCDEQVSVPLDRDGRFAYGSVLLKLAADRAAAPCEWAVSLSARETIERRLMCVLHAEKLKGRRRLLAFALAAAILTCGTAAALAVRKPLVRQEDDAAQNSRIENAALRETLAERDAQKDAESAREAAVWFTPEDIRDIQSAELVWWDGTVYATLDDGAPAYLESLLDEGTEIASSGCPFHSILYLRRSDGVLGKILPAEDSCAVFQSGGVYYDFGPGDNGELYALFGVNTAKLPQYSGADIQTPAEAVAAPGDTAPSGGTAAPLYPDALRGDTALILSRGGTLLPDDDEASYTVMGGIPYKFFESKPRAGEKRGTVYFEYKVGNKELLDGYQLSLLDTLVNGEFPRNSSGSSYGFDALDEYVGYSPDLHRAGGTKGEIGYTKHSDIFAIPQYTADECPHEFTVPLYDSEENIIGAFPVSCGGHLDPAATGMTIDDAKTAIAGGAV